MLQLLPRSSTGERMNPYTSIWSGVADGDGPREFHLVLLDAGRTDVLADEVGRARAALHPLLGVPERLPGLRAHRRPRLRIVYPGPIGAILTPQLQGLEQRADAALGLARCAAPATRSAR